MKMSRSGNGFGPGARNALKRLSGGSKNQIFGPDRKRLARNENKPFWQWFWARSQKCFKTVLEAPKTRYSVQTEKWFAHIENEPFWQWFWARGQKCFKTVFWRVQKPDRYSVQTEKWVARNENEPFWQWFWARSQKCFKTASGGSKNQIFGPDQKMARAQ